MDLAEKQSKLIGRLGRFLVYWPIIVLPIFLGGARPWLWGGVAGIFGVAFALILWKSQEFISVDDVKKPLLVLLPILLYPFFQAIPIPLSILAILSPQRALWLQRAREATGGSSWGASLSYVPMDTLFSGLWFVMLALFALSLHSLIRKGVLKSDRFFLVLFIIASLEALYGIFQVLVPSIGVFGMYPAAGVASGTFVNRNHYAAFLGLIWPLQLAWLMALSHKEEVNDRTLYDDKSRKQMTREKQVFFLFLTGLVLMGLIFSGSRGGILSALIGTTVLVLFAGTRGRSMRRFVAGCWVIMIAYGWIVGFEAILDRFLRMEDDAAGRFEIWEATWKMIRDHWLTGTGVGTYKPVVFLYNLFHTDLLQIGQGHNDYLQILAEWGLVFGLFIILLVWGYWIATAIDLVRKNQGGERQTANHAEERLIRAGALAGIGAFLCHIWVEFNWQIAANQLYFVMLLVLMRFRVPPDSKNLEAARHTKHTFIP
ncbi:MAG: O-antigen ligase family protein [Syntrophobacteraceae bacterium]